jgi:hypothetical protein
VDEPSPFLIRLPGSTVVGVTVVIERVCVAVMLCIRVRKAVGSILSRDTGYPN